jgi:hypothetical protein
MRQVMVRDKVKPERLEESEELVRAVADELRRAEPAGLRYATFSWTTAWASDTSRRRERAQRQPGPHIAWPSDGFPTATCPY